jgi:hypothetical protein
MNTNIHKGSAQIIPFPVRTRLSTPDQRHEAHTAFSPSPYPQLLVEDCWYHDAAVKQSVISPKP